MHPCGDKLLTFPHDDSCGRQLASLEGISYDLVHHVADYISVEDLIALSAVSKHLRDLLSDPGVWRKLHRRSTLLLPPGPYDWQSTPYLVRALLRAEKLHSLWPSSSSRPTILRTQSMSFGCDATFAVLMGRWLLVAEGSTLVCYDSQSSDIPMSAKTLFDGGGSRIVRVFGAGSVRGNGILAFAVLLFRDSFVIAKVPMEQGQPSEVQPIFTSQPMVAEGWTDLVRVRLYHRLLVVNVGESPAEWESCGGLVIMDADTLCQYRIPTSTYDSAFGPIPTSAFVFATKTHLLKVVEWSNRYRVRFMLECFPLSAVKEAPENDVLLPSHRSRVTYGPKLRECAVIHESPLNPETGKVAFTLFGLNDFSDNFSDTGRLEIVEVCLEPDGNISFNGFGFDTYLVTSYCLGWSRQLGCGVGLRSNKQPLVFALDYRGPGSFVFRYTLLDRRFPTSELLALDTFEGTAFFSRRSDQDTSVEMVDFVRDAQKMEGCQSRYALDSQMKITCACGECYMSDSGSGSGSGS